MASFVVAAQLLLAAVFVAAGAAKLFDLAGSRRAVADFGVPAWAASPIGTLLPLVELATAAALVLHPSTRWGAAAALVLLLLFVAGVASAMARGRDVDCGCFGRVYSATAGSPTLVRNVVLAGLAAVVLSYDRPPAIDDWAAARTPTEIVAIAATTAAVALAGLSLLLLARNRGLRRRLADATPPGPAGEESHVHPEGLPTGTAAPDFDLPDFRGETHSLGSLRAHGRPVILAFMESTCAPCNALMPALNRWQSSFADRVTIAVIASGSANRALTKWEREFPYVLFDESREVFDAYNVRATPHATAIAPDGAVSGGPAGGLHMIEVLVRLVLTEGHAAGQSESELAGLPPLLEVRPKTANSDGRASLTRPASASQVQEIAFEAFGVIASVSTPDAWLLPKLRELVPPHSRPCDVRPVEHRFTLTQDGPGRFSVRHIVAGDERERPGDGVARLDATDSTAGPAPGDALRQELSSYLASHVNLDLALAVLYDHLHGTIALHAPAHVFVRAGVVSHQRGALLLPGMGLTGKTTLVAELVREGTTYFSDEYAVIDEQGLVHPYPSLAFLDPHDEKSEDELDEHRRPTSGQEPLPIEALALTSYRPGAVWHPKRLSRGEAIVEVISHAVPAQERPEHTMLTVTRALAHDPLAIASDRDEADSVASLFLAELNHGLPSLRQ